MSIDEALELLESEHMAKDIKDLTPKDRLNFWASLKEFQTPKLQRSLFEPIKDDQFKILIERYNATNKDEAHQGISQPMDKSKKD